MNFENIITVLALIAFLIFLTLILLTPQIVGLIVYRFLRAHLELFAAPICFLIAPLLYCCFFYYFWYLKPPAPVSGNPAGEGDLVIPALITYGLIMNLGFGITLYANLFVKHLRRTRSE